MISLFPVMGYVDPASTSLLARILAPVFILVSAFGVHFRHRLAAWLQRLFRGRVR